MLKALIFAATLAASAVGGERAAMLKLNLRTQTEEPIGSGKWRTETHRANLPADQTAIIICDMWDKHWCASATRRCGEIAKRMEPVLEAARAKGVFIVHAPSECMDAYKDTPQRKRMQEAPAAPKPTERSVKEPPLPIDDSDGGCDDQPQCRTYRAWKTENPTLRIAPEDGISDKGDEIYRTLKARGITNVLIMGVHANMCVLGRSFAIRQMTKWGMRCILVRDLTDTMYNPRMRPNVPHEEGTALVVDHIEKYWCPSVLSKDLR